MSGPDFRELVGEDVPAEERARLKRAHDLLVAAGPPPELTPALEAPPEPGARVEWLPRRRRGATLVLAAALVLSAFLAGFLIGDRNDESSSSASFQAERTVVLGESGEAVAVVRIGAADRNGNHPLLVTVEGLQQMPNGDYYSLFMEKKGKPVRLCGTFNVAGTEPTTVRFVMGYGFEGFDGLRLSEYHAADHSHDPLLRAPL